MEVRTQAELDAALKAGDTKIILRGGGYFCLSGSATVRASDSATVRASGSATVWAWDSATVEASDSATVWASGSAAVRASGSAAVRASGSAAVRATANVFVRLLSKLCEVSASASVVVLSHVDGVNNISGGRTLKAGKPTTGAAWCKHHGIPTVKGVAVLFKAVGDNFYSPRGGDYTPGTVPVAPDWDGGTAECGGGYHYSPTPAMALSFNSGATKFVACPVRVKDIAVHPDGQFPEKVKAPGCCAPCWECDIDGARIAAEGKPR